MQFPNVVVGDRPMRYVDVEGALAQSSIAWSDLAWIREAWGPAPIVVKGVLTGDDARRAADAGADAVVVSNHGGRQLDGVSPRCKRFPKSLRRTAIARGAARWRRAARQRRRQSALFGCARGARGPRLRVRSRCGRRGRRNARDRDLREGVVRTLRLARVPRGRRARRHRTSTCPRVGGVQVKRRAISRAARSPEITAPLTCTCCCTTCALRRKRRSPPARLRYRRTACIVQVCNTHTRRDATGRAPTRRDMPSRCIAPQCRDKCDRTDARNRPRSRPEPDRARGRQHASASAGKADGGRRSRRVAPPRPPTTLVGELHVRRAVVFRLSTPAAETACAASRSYRDRDANRDAFARREGHAAQIDVAQRGERQRQADVLGRHVAAVAAPNVQRNVPSARSRSATSGAGLNRSAGSAAAKRDAIWSMPPSTWSASSVPSILKRRCFSRPRR